MELVARRMDKLHKLARVGDKAAGSELEALSLLLGAMDDGAFVRTLPEDIQAAAADLDLLTSNSMLYVANLSEEQLAGSPKLEALSSLAEQEGTSVVPICGDMEAEIALLEDAEERRAFLADLGLDRSGLSTQSGCPSPCARFLSRFASRCLARFCARFPACFWNPFQDRPSLKHVNSGLMNSAKVSLGFVPAFLTFYLTKDWWLLAYFGAVTWFGSTGLRNILQPRGGWWTSASS